MIETKRVSKKVCLLGDPSVGKTSLIRKYVFDMFEDKYLSTIGAKITKKVIGLKYKDPYPDIELTFMIWDIAGQKTIGAVHPSYYRGAEGAFIVCDLTRKETLENIPEWANSFFKVAGEVPIFILGNKSDLSNREFGETELSEMAKRFNAPYFITSAKVGTNVEESFKAMGKTLAKSYLAKIMR